jgi:hypothetical protein
MGERQAHSLVLTSLASSPCGRGLIWWPVAWGSGVGGPVRRPRAIGRGVGGRGGGGPREVLGGGLQVLYLEHQPHLVHLRTRTPGLTHSGPAAAWRPEKGAGGTTGAGARTERSGAGPTYQIGGSLLNSATFGGHWGPNLEEVQIVEARGGPAPVAAGRCVRAGVGGGGALEVEDLEGHRQLDGLHDKREEGGQGTVGGATPSCERHSAEVGQGKISHVLSALSSATTAIFNRRPDDHGSAWSIWKGDVAAQEPG